MLLEEVSFEEPGFLYVDVMIFGDLFPLGQGDQCLQHIRRLVNHLQILHSVHLLVAIVVLNFIFLFFLQILYDSFE